MKIENNYYKNNISSVNLKTPSEKKFSTNITKEPTVDSLLDPVTVPVSVLRRKVINERLKLLKPLNDQEYKDTLKKITSFDYMNNPPFVYIGAYSNTKPEFIGLVPYCGEQDMHDSINCWLTGRDCDELYDTPDEKIADIVNAFDYSLEKLDEKFGKYEGIVYRYGFFNPITDKQYYSSSFSGYGAVRFAYSEKPSPKKQYSIIKVKNGHNIEEFQKFANTRFSKKFAENEKEIIIDRKSNFRLISEKEYTKEDKKLKAKLLAQTIFDKDNVTENDIQNALKKHRDKLKYISIWEEV